MINARVAACAKCYHGDELLEDGRAHSALGEGEEGGIFDQGLEG